MEKPKVLNNSQIICTSGSAPVALKVTSQLHSKIEGQLIATEMDHKPMQNISSFGTCSLKNGSPCSPSISKPWKGCSFITIENKKKLLPDSMCSCDTGGQISIISTIQNFVN